MKSIAEHLRNLSKTHRNRVQKAQDMARKMKETAEAYKKATQEGET